MRSLHALVICQFIIRNSWYYYHFDFSFSAPFFSLIPTTFLTSRFGLLLLVEMDESSGVPHASSLILFFPSEVGVFGSSFSSNTVGFFPPSISETNSDSFSLFPAIFVSLTVIVGDFFFMQWTFVLLLRIVIN